MAVPQTASHARDPIGGSHAKPTPRRIDRSSRRSHPGTQASVRRDVPLVRPRRSIPSVSAIVYFIGLGVWLFANILNTSFFASAIDYEVVVFVCISIIAAGQLVRIVEMILSARLSVWGEWLLETLVFAALIWVAAQDTTLTLAFGLIFIYCARSVDFRQLAIVCAAVMGLALIFVIGASLIGVVENFTTPDERHRMYLGFLYALFPAQYMLSITCLVIYVRGRHLHWIEALMLLVMNAWFFITTDSRMCFVFSLIAICASLVVHYGGFRMTGRGVSSVLVALVFVICAAAGIAFATLYDPSIEWMASLDQALSGRISYAHNALADYGIDPFPRNEVRFVGNGLLPDGTRVSGEYNYVDCLYVQLVVRFGLVLSLGLLALHTYACFKARYNREPILMVIFAVIALHCLLDDLSILIWYNPFLLFIGNLNPRSEQQWEVVSADAGRYGGARAAQSGAVRYPDAGAARRAR